MRAATLLALVPLAMAAPTKRASPAPILKPRGAEIIEGKYIVKMKSGIKTAAVDSAVASITSHADYTYSSHFSGFAGSLSEEEVKLLQDNPDVEYIEHDAIVTIAATENQENAPWGLARISSSSPGGSTYTYDSSGGEGTCSYVVDTGIDVDHKEFGGRAEFLKNFSNDGEDNDGKGHGTHVAGTIGSATFGVAKKTKLFGVKVLPNSGSGQFSDLIAGLDFIVDDAPNRDCPNGIVVNMSLGGALSESANAAAANIVSAGYFLAIAAGNARVDAGQTSPASEKSACTVGATDKADTLAEYSNFGSVVDVLAPGTDIESTWPGGRTNTISGTSMASPHVAGLAAYFMGLGQNAKGLCEYIASKGLEGVIQGVRAPTPNVLVNNGNSNGQS